jgi:hypothetical protein
MCEKGWLDKRKALITLKHKARLERPVRNRHSGLLQTDVNYDRKSNIRMGLDTEGPCLSIIKADTFCGVCMFCYLLSNDPAYVSDDATQGDSMPLVCPALKLSLLSP